MAQNAHNIEALVACFAADYSSEQPAHPDRVFTGNAQVRKNWSSIFASVPDFRAELHDSAVHDDTAWGEFEWRGGRGGGAAPPSPRGIIRTGRNGKLAPPPPHNSQAGGGGRGAPLRPARGAGAN